MTRSLDTEYTNAVIARHRRLCARMHGSPATRLWPAYVLHSSALTWACGSMRCTCRRGRRSYSACCDVAPLALWCCPAACAPRAERPVGNSLKTRQELAENRSKATLANQKTAAARDRCAVVDKSTQHTQPWPSLLSPFVYVVMQHAEPRFRLSGWYAGDWLSVHPRPFAHTRDRCARLRVKVRRAPKSSR